MSDVPTQRFDLAPTPPEGEPVKKSRGLLITLIVIGAALLIAVVVFVLILLLGDRGGGTALPTPSPTPATSVTPSATPTPTPTPTPTTTSGGGSGGGSGSGGGGGTTQPTGAAFSSFSPVTQVHCEFAAPNFTPPPIPIDVKWSAIRTDSVWFVQGTSDAADSGFMQIPVNGDQGNFPYEIDFPCYQTSAVYTITLVGTDGHHVSKHWTVTNTGDHN